MCTITKKKKKRTWLCTRLTISPLRYGHCMMFRQRFLFHLRRYNFKTPKKITFRQHPGKKKRNLISAPSGLVWIPAAPFPSQSPHDYSIFCSQLSRCLHSGEITSDPLKWKTTAEGFSSALKIHLNWNMKFCCCRQLFVTYTGASFPGNTYSSIFLADTSEGQTLNI